MLETKCLRTTVYNGTVNYLPNIAGLPWVWEFPWDPRGMGMGTVISPLGLMGILWRF